MGSLFSRKKEPERPKITEQDKAVLDSIPGSTKLKNDEESLKSQVSPKGGKQNWPALKQQRDKLKQYQKKIQLNLEKERQLAKKLLQEGKKNKAKLLLKKKRYQEQTLERTDNQLENLEKMVQDVEFAQIQLQVADGLKQGNEALKKMHEIMSIEDVEKIMDETKEGIEYQREIDELLSGSLTQEDEDAVLEELEEMTKSIAEDDQEFPTELPEVPTNEPGEKRAPKAKETRREAEMVQA